MITVTFWLLAVVYHDDAGERKVEIESAHRRVQDCYEELVELKNENMDKVYFCHPMSYRVKGKTT